MTTSKKFFDTSITDMLKEICSDISILNEIIPCKDIPASIMMQYIPFSLKCEGGTLRIGKSSANIFFLESSRDDIWKFIHNFEPSMIRDARVPITITMRSDNLIYLLRKLHPEEFNMENIDLPPLALIDYEYIGPI